jgi:hypothetical protein
VHVLGGLKILHNNYQVPNRTVGLLHPIPFSSTVGISGGAGGDAVVGMPVDLAAAGVSFRSMAH